MQSYGMDCIIGMHLRVEIYSWSADTYVSLAVQNDTTYSVASNITQLSPYTPQYTSADDNASVGVCQLSGTVQDCCKFSHKV